MAAASTPIAVRNVGGDNPEIRRIEEEASMFDQRDPSSRYSWTQPMCVACYAVAEPGRVPITLRDSKVETCCACGKSTRAGIFYHIDPATAAFPTHKKS